jgi:hypothetical protein
VVMWWDGGPVIAEGRALRFLLDSARPRITLAGFTGDQSRFNTLARTDGAEAERLAEHAVDLRWDTHEEMATRPGHRLPADGRPSKGLPAESGRRGRARQCPGSRHTGQVSHDIPD